MTQSLSELTVTEVTDELEVGRVNRFFNAKPIKQELNRFIYRPTLERAFEREDRRLFYVECKDEIIGALMVWCESRVLDSTEAQIRLIAVAEGYRGHGIGKQLCEEAEFFAAEYGMETISSDVHCDSPAVHFWKACGYNKDYAWETDNGSEMYRMKKHL